MYIFSKGQTQSIFLHSSKCKATTELDNTQKTMK